MSTKKALTVAFAAAVLFAPALATAQQDPQMIALGAQVYSDTCGRCHNARSASERTDREWVTIVAHMRARANLSRTQAASVLAFLQATNVPEGAMAPTPVPAGDVTPRPQERSYTRSEPPKPTGSRERK